MGVLLFASCLYIESVTGGVRFSVERQGEEAMTDDELKALVASLIVAQKETDRQFKAMTQETDRQFKAMLQKANRRNKELGQQIGGLGQKFGGFTEGMAFPSMDKILRKRFGMENVSTRVKVSRNGGLMEMDVLAYANGKRNAVYVVEVKSRLRQDGIEQILQTLDRFPHFFPEHKGKALYGMLGVVDFDQRIKEEVLQKGLLLARIQDECFTLDVPADFKQHRFDQ